MEYNAKLRAGIYGFAAMVLVACCIIAVTVASTVGRGRDVPVAGEIETDDAVLANGVPDHFETLPSELPMETTTGNTAEIPEPKKPVYYVTMQENKAVLLDGEGNFLLTVNDKIPFLPKVDIERIRIGIPIYTDTELQMLLEELT